MDQEERKEFAKDIAAAFHTELKNSGIKSSCEFCSGVERREHRDDHSFVKSLRSVADRWDNVRWEVGRDILKWTSRIIVSAALLGLILLATKWTGGFRL